MLSPVLARTLAADRVAFNESVADARQRMPGFNIEAFQGFVTSDLDTLAAAVEKMAPERVTDVVRIAFTLGLDLVGQGLLGSDARLPWVGQAWRIAPLSAKLVASAPQDVLATLTNAAVTLGSTPGVRPEQWLDLMQSAAPLCADLNTLRCAGAVCAWRSGMVQLRDAALNVMEGLHEQLARLCLAVPLDAPWDRVKSGLRSSRWIAEFEVPNTAAGWTLGGFTGFGGPFSEPPEIRRRENHFVARSRERHFLVFADAFGAAAVPSTAVMFESAQSRAASLSAADLDARAVQLGVPAEGLLAVATDDTVLVASRWSHHLLIGPLGP